MSYSVQKLAKLSGVSVRTLHYYDAVELLKPAYYGNNGYRYYEEKQLLLLQQILFFKKLGISLQNIKTIIRKSDFDKEAALHSHRKVLVRNIEHTKELIKTIDCTIEHLKGKRKMKGKEFFEGLNSPNQKEYEQYLLEKGKISKEELLKGRKKLEKWSEKEWEKMGLRWDEIQNGYIHSIEKGPNSKEAIDTVKLHLAYLKEFGIEVKKEELVTKAHSFFDHPDWKAKFDAKHPKLLEFMFSAIEAYAKKE